MRRYKEGDIVRVWAINSCRHSRKFPMWSKPVYGVVRYDPQMKPYGEWKFCAWIVNPQDSDWHLGRCTNSQGVGWYFYPGEGRIVKNPPDWVEAEFAKQMLLGNANPA